MLGIIPKMFLMEGGKKALELFHLVLVRCAIGGMDLSMDYGNQAGKTPV
jgi:hypothetical protein